MSTLRGSSGSDDLPNAHALGYVDYAAPRRLSGPATRGYSLGSNVETLTFDLTSLRGVDPDQSPFKDQLYAWSVEQELHVLTPNSASISLSPIRSKSSGTAISPERNPRRCGLAGASSADTLTSGLPALAITNGSPLAARSTSLESWVFASWMLTVTITTSWWTKVTGLSCIPY